MSSYRRRAALQGYRVIEPSSAERDLDRIVRLLDIIRGYESLVDYLLNDRKLPPPVNFPCDAFEEQYRWQEWMVASAIDMAGGNKNAACKILGFTHAKTLYNWEGKYRGQPPAPPNANGRAIAHRLPSTPAPQPASTLAPYRNDDTYVENKRGTAELAGEPEEGGGV